MMSVSNSAKSFVSFSHSPPLAAHLLLLSKEMKSIATICFVALALLSVATVARAADETCDSAATCGDHWLARQFTGLDCPTSTVNVTYTILPDSYNKSICIGSASSNSSLKTSCSRTAKRYTYNSYTGTSSCQASRLAFTVNYPTGVCLNNDDATNPSSVVYYCSFADTPSYTSEGHTALTTTAVPTDTTCTLNSTSVNSGCMDYAYVKSFSGSTCQGEATFGVASNVGAPALGRCYIDRGSQMSTNVKSTCSGSSVVETVYSNGCTSNNFAYSTSWPVGVCIPSADGTTSRMYGCPGSAASALSVSAFALFLAIAAFALLAL